MKRALAAWLAACVCAPAWADDEPEILILPDITILDKDESVLPDPTRPRTGVDGDGPDRAYLPGDARAQDDESPIYHADEDRVDFKDVVVGSKPEPLAVNIKNTGGGNHNLKIVKCSEGTL